MPFQTSSGGGAGGGGGGGYAPLSIQTGDFTAVVGTDYGIDNQVDPASPPNFGQLNITMPASPVDGDYFRIRDVSWSHDCNISFGTSSILFVDSNVAGATTPTAAAGPYGITQNSANSGGNQFQAPATGTGTYTFIWVARLSAWSVT